MAVNQNGLSLQYASCDLRNDKDIVYESHQDIVEDLPENIDVLAYTDKAIQSFQYGEYVYGVQFHPEFSWDVTRMLMDLRIKKGIKISKYP